MSNSLDSWLNSDSNEKEMFGEDKPKQQSYSSNTSVKKQKKLSGISKISRERPIMKRIIFIIFNEFRIYYLHLLLDSNL